VETVVWVITGPPGTAGAAVLVTVVGPWVVIFFNGPAMGQREMVSQRRESSEITPREDLSVAGGVGFVVWQARDRERERESPGTGPSDQRQLVFGNEKILYRGSFMRLPPQFASNNWKKFRRRLALFYAWHRWRGEPPPNPPEKKSRTNQLPHPLSSEARRR